MSHAPLLSSPMTYNNLITCRICLERLNLKKDPTLCDCKGSNAYHHKCLIDYINSQSRPKFKCEICKKPYLKNNNDAFIITRAYDFSKIVKSNSFYFLIFLTLILIGVSAMIYINIGDNPDFQIIVGCVLGIVYLIYLVRHIIAICQEISVPKYSIKKGMGIRKQSDTSSVVIDVDVVVDSPTSI